MKRRGITWVFVLMMAVGLVLSPRMILSAKDDIVQIEAEQAREKLHFNQGWKFVRRNIPEAVKPDYDMAELERWENVDLPHSVRLEEENTSGGKNYQGPAMYRKHFYLSDSYKDKKLYIEFEGVMGVTDVWVNGKHLQGHMAEKTGENTQYGGYLPFILDITDAVHCDGEANVITVLTDNSDNVNVPPGKPQGQLDFTYFGGIYRNVWLHSVNNVHITDELFEDETAGGGILVDFPEVSPEQAIVDIKTHIRNEDKEEKQISLVTKIVNQDGTVVGEDRKTLSLPGAGAGEVKQSVTVENPELWDLDHPYMHTIVSEVYADGAETDRTETPAGIRKIEMDAQKGILINNKHAGFLSGVNRHQEYPYIGYAASDSLQRRDAIKFKSAGFHIVRTAHHPQSEEFLKACDELGILVIEAIPGWQHWSDDKIFAQRVKNDIRQMVRRDRNHPSILTFEISLNESPGVPEGFTNELEQVAKEEHPSLKTSAENPHGGAKGDILYGTPEEVESWSDTALSLIREYGDHWEEQFGNFINDCRVTRGKESFYPGGEARMVKQANNRLWKGYSFEGTGAVSLSEGIQNYKDSAHRFAGMTMWIGIDHNRGYHETMSPCGIWDLKRIPKYSYYAFASQRSAAEDEYLESQDVATGPMIFIASSWGTKAPVVDKSNQETVGTDSKRMIYVYSNADKVKLCVMGKNDEILWEQENVPLDEGTSSNLEHPPYYFENVPYTEGSYLKAEGYDADGNVIAGQEVHTAKEPARLRLEVDDSGNGLTADGSDQVMVYAYVLDEEGNVCTEADNKLKFSVEGQGSIIGNGDKRVGANPVNAEAGVAGIFIQAGKNPGKIQVTVSSPGMEPESVELQTREMTDKRVPYEEIAQGTPMDQVSMYLTDKQESVPGEDPPGIVKDTVSIDGEDYTKSMEVKNMAPVMFELDGGYEKLTGKAAVKNPEKTKSGVKFKIYGDGALLYVSDPVTSKAAEIDVDITGVKTLMLCAEDEKGLNEVIPCWLSLYITEGKGNPDESELQENVAVKAAVTATSSDVGTVPDNAVDGDILTLWRSGNKVTEQNSESLYLDLGQEYDIRNARLAVEHDYLKCTYTIYTSSDNVNWDKKSESSKTAHANGELDYFTASKIRYIKIEFTKVESTQGETGGSLPRASIKELELFKDKGVDTVKDYNLSGLSVAGHDILFRQNQTAYEISLTGNEKEVWVKAFPANTASQITINGEKVETGHGDTLMDMEYIRIVPDENNNITAEVVSPDKKGVKQYKIHIREEERKQRYGAWESFVPGENGANGWTYRKMDKESGDISDLEGKGGYIAGEYAWEGGNWLYAGPRYMHPASNVNAVRTFEAPQAGRLSLRASAQKYLNQPGQVSLSVLKNGERIWPVNKNKEVLEAGKTLQILTTSQVLKGDLIQIVLDAEGDNGGDATYIESYAEYQQDAQEENAVYLSDLEWKSAEAGYGSVNRDVSSSGQQICLTDEEQNPAVYEKGLGTHAESRIVYDIKNKGYTRFRSNVGIDYSQNSAGNPASVRFKVYFNDEKQDPVYDSGEMVSNTPQKTIDLEIGGLTEKIILVAEQGENNWSDHADWADARFLSEYQRGDKTLLGKLLQEAQDIVLQDYTDPDGDGFRKFKASLLQAENVFQDERASQEEINAAHDELDREMKRLKEKEPEKPEDYIIHVTDYGADPKGSKDSAQAVIKALDRAAYLRKKNPDQEIVIDFPQGKYQIYPDKAEERELYVSNTVGADSAYKDKKIGILIEDLNHIVMEGNGSVINFHGKMTAFAAIRSENVRFQNFTVDFEVPTVVDITVESVDGNTATVYIPECYEYSIENGQINWFSDKSPYTGKYYWTGTDKFENNYAQSIDLRTGITTRSNELFDNRAGMEDLGNRRVKITYNGKPDSVTTGMCYQMRPTRRDTPGAFFWLSKDIEMENLDIRYLHGFGMVGQTTDNISLRDVDFRAPEETGRTTAGYADFLQMSGCGGKILVEDCYFANPHDDPINIHGTFQQVVSISGDRREVTVRYNHDETAGFPSFFEGDQVEFTRQSNMLPLEDSICTVEEIISGPTGSSSEGISLTDTVIRFTEPIPDEVQEWQFVAENITDTPEVEIRRNTFKQIPTRGILVTTRKPVLIEENVFEGTSMAAIYISCDAQSWYESGRVEDVTIQNNKFYRCQGNGVIFIEPTNPNVSVDSTVHKNIQITGNEFYQSGSKVVDAKSVDGITIEGNRIFRFEPNVDLALTLNGETAQECTISVGEGLQAEVKSSASQLDNDLYSFNGCKNVSIQNNEYDAGMKMNVSINNMDVSDINLSDKEGISIGEGEKAAALGEVYYESSSPDIAKVSADGKILGISKGEALIRAYSVINDRKYASAPLQVNVGAQTEIIYPQSVKLISESDVLDGAGSTLQITAALYPENAQMKDVVYTVEDIRTGAASDVAAISQDGLLTAKKAGAVLVKGTASNGISAAKLVVIRENTKVLSNALTILNPVKGTWGLDQEELYICPSGAGDWESGNGATNIVLAELADSSQAVITVEMEGKTHQGYEETGLVFYRDADNYTAIQRKHANGNPKLNVITEKEGNPSESGIDDIFGEIIYLKLEKTESVIRGYYSTDGSTWNLVQEVENTGLDDSLKAGILCTCGDGTSVIRFRDFMVNEEAVPFGEEAVIQEVSSVEAAYDENSRSLTADYLTSAEKVNDVIRWMVSDAPDGNYEILDGYQGTEIRVPYSLNGFYFKPVVIPMLSNGAAGVPVVAAEPVQTNMKIPEAVSNSNLETVLCEETDFGEFDKNQKYYIAAEYENKAVRFQVVPTEGASVQVLLNGNELGNIQTDTITVPLFRGINAVEMFVTAEDGITQSVYRYVILHYVEKGSEAPDADLTSLNLAISMAEAMEKEQEENQCYTEETWAAVAKALNAARAILKDPSVTQEQADEAFINLITACFLVENGPQKTGLKAAIEGTEAILADTAGLSQYTEESVAEVRKALLQAQQVFDSNLADQGTINEATTRLLTAVTSMMVEKADTRLDILIQKAEELLKMQDQYTAISVQNLKDILAQAKETAENSQASPEEMNTAYEKLADAMVSLVRKGNKEELKNALDKANEILKDAKKYLEASMEGLSEMTAEAQTVYDNQNADQDLTGEALKKLIIEILEVRLLGDVDLNGVVDTKDAAKLLKYNAEKEELSEEQLQIADMNGDNLADSRDAVTILRYAAELAVFEP